MQYFPQHVVPRDPSLQCALSCDHCGPQKNTSSKHTLGNDSIQKCLEVYCPAGGGIQLSFSRGQLKPCHVSALGEHLTSSQ